MERALFNYDNNVGGLAFVFTDWDGFQLASGAFPAGAGTSFGVGYTHDLGGAHPAADLDRPNRVQVDVLGAYSTREYSRGAAR